MTPRILIVAADPSRQHLPFDPLRREGFDVTGLLDGHSALEQIERQGLPHLVVIDLRLPDMSGLALARGLTVRGAPVIITDSTLSQSAVKSLEWADDYVRLPVATSELAARIQNVLRRIINFGYAGGRIQKINGRFQIDHATNEVMVAGEPVRLTPIESRLLHVLLWHRGNVVDSRTLLLRVWSGMEIYQDTLRVHIHRLRQKIEPDVRRPHYIHTERGVGYRFAV